MGRGPLHKSPPSVRRRSIAAVALFALFGMITLSMRVSAQSPSKASSAAADPNPHGGGTTVFLLVTLNGNTASDLAEFTDRDGQLTISREHARQLGFRASYLSRVPPDTPLSAYPRLKIKYNASLQSLSITAPFSILALATTKLGEKIDSHTVARASPGVLLNYDLYSTYGNSRASSTSGFTQLRAFNDFGVFSDSYLLQAQHIPGEPGWRHSAVRTDTTFEHSLQDKGITVRFGDTLTDALSWTRQTRIGGLQIARDFTLQPYQSTAPLPAYFGTAALPSSVQLYVNGIQQYSGKVPAGPLQLNIMPTVTGAGQAQVVMTDALGRQTTVNFPFYSTTNLLRKGLTDWSFETGYVRKDYGLRSFAYSAEPMVSGTIRHGITNSITLEGHAETSRGLTMGGLGTQLALGTWGTASASLAQSHYAGLSGSQYAIGYQLQRGPLGLGANTQRTRGDFRDVATLYGSIPVARSDSAYIGLDTGVMGSFGLNYVGLNEAGAPPSRYAGISWSKSLAHGITVSLGANQNLANRSDRTVSLGLTFNFDRGLSAYSSAVRANGVDTATVSLTKSAQNQGDWSWNLQAQDAGAQSRSASVQVSRQTQYADVNLGVTRNGANQTTYGGVSGSLVAMGGGIFASRRIDDGFAVVSTDDIPDVPVKDENRLVGNTNGRGLLLVPTLRSYQDNKVSIDPTNLPADMRIKGVNENVVPRRGSGVNVTFSIERIHAASIILREPDGTDVPLGARATLNGDPALGGYVGYDGELYVEVLKKENQLVVRGAGPDCGARFAYEAKAGTLPRIGPLVCRPLPLPAHAGTTQAKSVR
ncbi:MAG: fimbrial biogenesis outer membrane usher protein [Candidimonas sp.]|nr:MAG: fimbrial biogenesis outer membrane usher protein [Candidimonas sp.]